MLFDRQLFHQVVPPSYDQVVPAPSYDVAAPVCHPSHRRHTAQAGETLASHWICSLHNNKHVESSAITAVDMKVLSSMYSVTLLLRIRGVALCLPAHSYAVRANALSVQCAFIFMIRHLPFAHPTSHHSHHRGPHSSFTRSQTHTDSVTPHLAPLAPRQTAFVHLLPPPHYTQTHTPTHTRNCAHANARTRPHTW